MARRRTSRPPEVRVAVRTEARTPVRFDAAVVAASALMAAWMASAWWLQGAHLAH